MTARALASSCSVGTFMLIAASVSPWRNLRRPAYLPWVSPIGPTRGTSAWDDGTVEETYAGARMVAKCRVPILIQDRSRGGSFEELTQDYDIEEPFFVDGPVTRRLAVVDFDPLTGARTDPVKLVAPTGGRR